MRSPLSLPFAERFPVALALMIVLLQVATGIMLFAIFQEYVPGELAAGDAWGGILLATYGAARFVSEAPTGAISDRIERKSTLLLGIAIVLPALLAASASEERFAFLGCAALLGLGSAFTWPASYAMTADLYPPERRGKVIGFLNVGQLAGFGIGALAGAFLVENHVGALFAVAIAVAALAGVVCLAAIPRYRERASGRPRRTSLREAWSAQLGFLSALVLISTSSISMIVPAIRPYGAEQLNISFAALTVALIPAVVLAVLLYVPAGHAADRFGRHIPFLGGQLLMIAGMLLVAETHTVAVAAVGGAVIFLGNVLSVPAFNAAVMDLAPESHRGTLIGLTVALSGLGLALGPLAGGAIAAALSPADVFRVAALLSGLAALAILAYGRKYSASSRAAENDAA